MTSSFLNFLEKVEHSISQIEYRTKFFPILCRSNHQNSLTWMIQNTRIWYYYTNTTTTSSLNSLIQLPFYMRNPNLDSENNSEVVPQQFILIFIPWSNSADKTILSKYPRLTCEIIITHSFERPVNLNGSTVKLKWNRKYMSENKIALIYYCELYKPRVWVYCAAFKLTCKKREWIKYRAVIWIKLWEHYYV